MKLCDFLIQTDAQVHLLSLTIDLTFETRCFVTRNRKKRITIALTENLLWSRQICIVKSERQIIIIILSRQK